ncbi:NAD(P)H-dependent oxidoreductase [Paenibacillus sp. NEAU-GSW1]|uniref:NAD(P)H-dependent oxidoreductase n=1 Tax=Paenibacillus sp. NEAU-GSW1 TaxID=2682486 RepID=UPI0012E2B497|nr:NAD(P)H-dependent oxidoreductase [Paenibacillus sp. NEAU-GSW1]MUT65770.1 flavodoxin family protein [Paenibacillus sp. NEAU-GSW1]
MNTLIIVGHPDAESYCSALARAYAEGASSLSANVRLLELGKLDFNPNLEYGYRKRTELEPDLLQAQEWIRWADHLVIVYPTWWGTMPAMLKGFMDRVLLPGFAFKYRENSALWDKLLTGKTAHLIVTSDTPSWFNRLVYRQAGHSIMKRNILGFCGVKTKRVTEVGPVRGSSDRSRDKWLEKTKELGSRFA